MGICPEASSLQVSREIGINSGGRGNMEPRQAGKERNRWYHLPIKSMCQQDNESQHLPTERSKRAKE